MYLVKHLKQVFLAALILIVNPLSAQQDCEFQMMRDGIKVYTCQRENSDFKAVRASFEVEASMELYASIVLNVEDYKYWNFAASNPKVIQVINEQELVYYTEVAAPWPVTDRFVVLHLTVRLDPETQHLWVILENVPDAIPQKDGLVRVKEYYSTLEIIPQGNGNLKIDYFLEVDPGGGDPCLGNKPGIHKISYKHIFKPQKKDLEFAKKRTHWRVTTH
jgi:hypothetical protein